MDKKATKFEKTKNEKCGSRIWTEVTDLAQLIRWVASFAWQGKAGTVGTDAGRGGGAKSRELVTAWAERGHCFSTL